MVKQQEETLKLHKKTDYKLEIQRKEKKTIFGNMLWSY